MERYYTINEIAVMSGLSTRTLRNYIKRGVLDGEKTDGIWMFTPEEYAEFLNHKDVKVAIRSHSNGIVYDFMADNKKEKPSVCVILDDFLEEADAAEVMEQATSIINSYKDMQGHYQFNLIKQGQYIRLILTGNIEMVSDFLVKYRDIR